MPSVPLSNDNGKGRRSIQRLHPKVLVENQYQHAIPSLERSLRFDNGLLGGAFVLFAVAVLAVLCLIVWLIAGLVSGGDALPALSPLLAKTSGVLLAGVVVERMIFVIRLLFAHIDNLHEKMHGIERSRMAASAAAVIGDAGSVERLLDSHLQPEPYASLRDGTPIELARTQLATSKPGRSFSALLGDVFGRKARGGKELQPEDRSKPGEVRHTA